METGSALERRPTRGLTGSDAQLTAAGQEAGVREAAARLRHVEACLTQPVEYAKSTGLAEQGLALNRMLAAAAQHSGLTMGGGSRRLAIERPELARYFHARDLASDVLLFANLGAAQVARGWGATETCHAVEMVGADALFIHFNPIQEAIQGADRDFRGVAASFHRRSARSAADLHVRHRFAGRGLASRQGGRNPAAAVTQRLNAEKP